MKKKYISISIAACLAVQSMFACEFCGEKNAVHGYALNAAISCIYFLRGFSDIYGMNALEGQYSEEAPQELNNNNNISDEEDSQSSEEDQKAEVLEAPQGVDIFLATLDTLALQDPSTFDILVDALIKIVRTSKIQLTKDTAVRWLLGVAQRKSTRTLVVAEVILEHTTDLLITVEVTSLLLNYAIQETTPWEDILAAAKLIFLYSTDDAAINKAGELVCAVVNHDHATRVDHAVGMLNGVAACRSARAKTVVRGLMQQATDAWILTRLKQARQDHWSSANRRE